MEKQTQEPDSWWENVALDYGPRYFPTTSPPNEKDIHTVTLRAGQQRPTWNIVHERGEQKQTSCSFPQKERDPVRCWAEYGQ